MKSQIEYAAFSCGNGNRMGIIKPKPPGPPQDMITKRKTIISKKEMWKRKDRLRAITERLKAIKEGRTELDRRHNEILSENNKRLLMNLRHWRIQQLIKESVK